MKNDYERISTFKGNKSMKTCQAIIASWREYAKYKTQMRETQENFLSKVVFNRYSSLLRTWQGHSHKCQTLKKRFILYQCHKNDQMLSLCFLVLSDNVIRRKNHRNQLIESSHYYREALLTKSLVAFDHFKKVQMAKREYTQNIIEQMTSCNLRRAFVCFKNGV